jgi:hypothetical protein
LQLEAGAGTPLQLSSAFQNGRVLPNRLRSPALARNLADFDGHIPPRISVHENRYVAFASREIASVASFRPLWNAKSKSRSNTMGESGGSPNDLGVSYRNRRSVPRYGLIAQTDVVEPVSGLHISGRISEVSLKGCYVDVLNTLPTQTEIEVRISRDQGTFTSPGKIIYTQEGMGMGVAFLNTPADQFKVLDSWIAELNAS